MIATPLNRPDSTPETSLPIGMFDSGVGGFTVYRQLKKILPKENILYFGDTANVPYGDKPPAVIRGFAKQIVSFLADKGVKAIAIACNVSSSVLTEDDLAQLEVPVFGLIRNGALASLSATKNKRIGVLATAATVQTSSYLKAIHGFSPETEVIQVACPKFVPLVEQGIFTGPEVDSAVSEYTASLRASQVDTVIYGCTHYPFLETSIAKHLPGVRLIDPAVEIIAELAAYLHNNSLLKEESIGNDTVYASSLNERFLEIANLFLGLDISPFTFQADLIS